jgi:PIN domain nuclease of toxin-antitoxin system
MRILLDTHILLWWLEDSAHLSATLRDIISDPKTARFYSSISIAEIRIKQAIGKLKPSDDFADVLLQQPFYELDFGVNHAHVLQSLPLHHRDPFDRMLIAQAQVENLTLITADTNILKYDLKLLSN